MKTYISISKGSYDFLHPKDVQVQVSIRGLDNELTGVHFLSETWPEDEDPGIDSSTLLRDVVATMKARLESYWINTRKDRELPVYAWLEANMDELERHWAIQRQKNLKAQIDRLQAEWNQLDVDYELSSVPLKEEFEPLIQTK
jgi:hypothetical protein